MVDQLVVLEADGRGRVIHGNYDTYEGMRLLQDEAPKRTAAAPPASEESRSAGSTSSTVKRKRRFPSRKVEELEADIAAQETRLRSLEQLLASADLYREGDKVKETTRSFEETRQSLAQLYEHWEEAVELN